MKTFFETFTKTIYDPAFYRSVAEAPLKEALVFYVKVALFLATVMTIIFTIVLVPQGIRFVKERAPILVKQYYPEQLVVRIDKGEASVNVSEPYIVLNKAEAPQAMSEKPVKNLIVIDTRSDFETKKFNEYDTFALLTKHEFATRDDNGKITIQNLSGFPSVVIDQAKLLSWGEKIMNSLTVVVPLGITLTLFLLFMGFIIYIIPLLLFALIPYFVAKLKKMSLTYSGAYKMSLYAVVPALALKTLLNISGFMFIPAYFTLLIFILIVTLNMRETEPEQSKLFEN
ncbi:MAG: DUF1189 family protein [Patescibacteria group bacterium]